jgi:hypothetical protein
MQGVSSELKKLVVAQLVLHGTRMFLVVLRSARPYSVSWIHSIPEHAMSKAHFNIWSSNGIFDEIQDGAITFTSSAFSLFF